MNSPTSIDITDSARFGAGVREARLRHGLTQEELAAVVGVHRRVIGELERGKPTVRLGIALSAAATVGLDVRFHGRG